MSKPISQSEARRLRKRVAKLERYIEDTRAIYSSDWPGGISLGNVSWSDDNTTAASVYVARKLGHAVVAVADGARRFNLFAVPHGNLP